MSSSKKGDNLFSVMSLESVKSKKSINRLNPALSGDIEKSDSPPKFISYVATNQTEQFLQQQYYPDSLKIKVHKPSHHKPEEHKCKEYMPKITYGCFAWDPVRASPANYGQQADFWLRFSISERSAIVQATKKLLFGPYLFQQPTIPNKWNKWAAKLNMLRANFSKEFSSFPNNSAKLPREQYLACRLIEQSFNITCNVMTSHRMILIRMLEMLEHINEKTDLEAVLKVYGNHENIKTIADSVKTMLETWISTQDSHYLSVKKRRIFAILLSCRQLAETIYIVTCEGRDLVREVEKFENRREEFEGSREILRNDAKNGYQEKDYARAHSLYTVSISEYSPMDSQLYRNRSLCYIKMQKYEEAYQDGLRAIVLDDVWVKAYHVFTNSLIQAKLYKEAFAVNLQACAQCSNQDPDFKNLEEQSKLLKSKQEVMESFPQEQTKKRNKRHEHQHDDDSSSEEQKCCDVEHSETDSEYEDSSDENAGLYRAFRKLHKHGSVILHNMPTKVQAKILRIKTTNRTEKELEEHIRQHRRQKAIEKKKKTIIEKIKQQQEKQKQEFEKKKLKKVRKSEPPQQRKSEVKKSETVMEKGRVTKEAKTSFNNALVLAHKSYVDKKFPFAAKHYDIALEVSDSVNIKDLNLTIDDVCMLWYARGLSSANQMIPIELNTSIKYFQRIIDRYPKFHQIAVAYYGIGFSKYYLNDFESSLVYVNKALRYLKAVISSIVLTWPGTCEEMKECGHSFLLCQLNTLEKNCRSPPKPAAVCLYSSCYKNYERKAIYHSDLGFEGYIIARCTMKCRLSVHLDCWDKFKNEYDIGSDEQVLEHCCWTNACDGIVDEIVCVDEFGIHRTTHTLKKIRKKDRKTQMKHQPKTKRMSKSERNLEKVKLRKTEAKYNRKQKQDEERRIKEEKIMEKLKEMSRNMQAKNEYIEDKRTFNKGTAYKKAPDRRNNVMIKSKRGKERHKPVSVALCEFLTELPGFKVDMTLDDIQEAIDHIKLNNEPFEVPENLFLEMQELERFIGWDTNKMYITSDLQRMIAFHLLRYFENFFTMYGPMKSEEMFFQQQLEKLTIDMQDVIFQQYESLVEFLDSSNIFVYIPPYIGLTEQAEIIENLCKNFYQERQRKNSRELLNKKNEITDDHVGSSTTLSGKGLSPFAKDFYSLVVRHIDKFLPFDDEESDNSENKAIRNAVFDQVITKMKERSGNQQSQDLDGDFNISDLYEEEETEEFVEAVKEIEEVKTSSQMRTPRIDMVTKEEINICDDELSMKTEVRDAFTITEDVIIKIPVKTKVKQCQTAILSRTIHTQTKGKDELLKAKDSLIRMQDRISDLEDEAIKSRKLWSAKEKKFIRDIEELKTEKIKMIASGSDKKENRKQKANDTSKLDQEIKSLKDKNQNLQEDLNKMMVDYEHMQADVDKKEFEYEKLEEIFSESKEKFLSEKQNLKETNQMLVEKLMTMADKLKKAELFTLETQQNVGLMNLHKAKMECEQISREFENKLKLVGNDASIIAMINDAKNKWNNNTDECTKRIAMVKSHFAQQKEQIKGGTSLQDLSPVPIPAPPPSVTVTPRQLDVIIAKKMQSSTMKGFSGQVIQPPPATTSPHFPSSALPVKPPTPPAQVQNPVGSRNGLGNYNNRLGMGGNDKLNRLILMIQREFTHLDRNTILKYLNQVRNANNNTLSGLEHREILRRVKERADFETKTFSWELGNPSPPPFSSLLEDDTCVICYEGYGEQNVKILTCKHKFHMDCINRWLEKNKSCPNCRKKDPTPSTLKNEESGSSVTDTLFPATRSPFPRFLYPPGILEAASKPA